MKIAIEPSWVPESRVNHPKSTGHSCVSPFNGLPDFQTPFQVGPMGETVCTRLPKIRKKRWWWRWWWWCLWCLFIVVMILVRASLFAMIINIEFSLVRNVTGEGNRGFVGRSLDVCVSDGSRGSTVNCTWVCHGMSENGGWNPQLMFILDHFSKLWCPKKLRQTRVCMSPVWSRVFV